MLWFMFNISVLFLPSWTNERIQFDRIKERKKRMLNNRDNQKFRLDIRRWTREQGSKGLE